ncbi:MAG: YxeA family protein [Thermoactinomyces sp.]
MKKIFLVLGLILVIVVSTWMFFVSPEFTKPDNPEGKTIYYTQITGPGFKDNERYDYEVTAYDENGKEKKLVFSAGKKLRKGAYIELYYTFFRRVTYWEEISFEELPKVVQQKYQKQEHGLK